MRLNGRWKAVGIAALIGLLGAVVPMQLVSGQVTIGPFPDAGVLRLHLGASDYFRLDPPTGSGGSQTISVPSGCVVVSPTSGTLVSLSPVPAQGKVGLVADGLGVQVKGEGNGQPCGQVNPGQQLVLQLGTGSPLTGRAIDFAELDIEGKFDATVRADLYFNSTYMGSYLLPTGVRSDSGPDSKDGDNYRWRIPCLEDNPKCDVPPNGPDPQHPNNPAYNADPALSGRKITPFNKLVLYPVTDGTSGALSLEGGADGTPPLAQPTAGQMCGVHACVPYDPAPLGPTLATDTTDSLFHLVEFSGILNCPETLPNAVPGVDISCDTGTVPYLLARDDNTVRFLKDTTLTAFNMRVTWNDEEIPSSDVTYGFAPPRWTQIDYGTLDPVDPDRGLHDVRWCESVSGPDANGFFTGTVPADELWCLVSQDTTPVDATHVRVVELFYGSGDPKITR